MVALNGQHIDRSAGGPLLPCGETRCSGKCVEGTLAMLQSCVEPRIPDRNAPLPIPRAKGTCVDDQI